MRNGADGFRLDSECQNVKLVGILIFHAVYYATSALANTRNIFV